ncbi:MAG: hypothetical protein QM710_05430 [Flavobacterium sp.]
MIHKVAFILAVAASILSLASNEKKGLKSNIAIESAITRSR